MVDRFDYLCCMSVCRCVVPVSFRTVELILVDLFSFSLLFWFCVSLHHPVVLHVAIKQHINTCVIMLEDRKFVVKIRFLTICFDLCV